MATEEEEAEEETPREKDEEVDAGGGGGAASSAEAPLRSGQQRLRLTLPCKALRRALAGSAAGACSSFTVELGAGQAAVEYFRVDPVGDGEEVAFGKGLVCQPCTR